jgi:hypothetical protein
MNLNGYNQWIELSFTETEIKFKNACSLNSVSQSKEIIITYGINIPAIYNYDWNKYLPVIPKDLSTFFDSTPNYSPTNNTLFD